MSENPPKNALEVDDEWKNQAERDKERLAQQQPTTPAPSNQAAPPPPASPLPPTPSASSAAPQKKFPPASFELIIEQYATQILFALGAIPHPTTGKATKDLELAKHYIDLLALLETKTANNLTPDESNLLSTALYQMRMNYVGAAKSR